MNAALLIHGFCTDNTDFSRLLPFLSARYQKVWAINLPAHGPDCKKAKIYAKEVIAASLDAFDSLAQDYDSIDIFGFSMGGALATYLASVRKINRLILLAPANKYLSPSFLFVKMKHLAQGKKINSVASPRFYHTSTLQDIRKDTAEEIKLLFTRLLPRFTPHNIKEFNKVIKECNKNLKNIIVPTLILWGRFDQLVPENSVKHIIKFCRHPQTKTIIYSDISHIMLYSNAFHKIIDDILLFLEKTDHLSLTYKEKQSLDKSDQKN